MGKNANKKAKFKPIVFEIQKNRFKKALTNAINCSYFNYGERCILNGINFRIDNGILTLAATDANSLIKQEIKIDEIITPGVYQITLSGQHLYKAAFKNSYEFGRKRSMYCMDRLRITINEDSAIIEDILNGINYTVPALDYNNGFPNYDKLIPKNLDKDEKYTKIAFNTRFLARFADISSAKTSVGILRVNKEDPLKTIIITADDENDGINTTALLMPCQLRE